MGRRKEMSIEHASKDITYSVPTVLLEKYDEQVRRYGFRNNTEVLTYLAAGLWNEENGLQNSSYVKHILQLVTPERPSVLSCFPRITRALCMGEEDKRKVLSLCQYGYVGNLVNALLEAFLVAKSRDKRRMRKEMHISFVFETVAPYRIVTHLRSDQYDQLDLMAKRGGTTVNKLIYAAIDAMLTAEGFIPEEWVVPFEIQNVMQDILRIEGFTLHHFAREASIYTKISEKYSGAIGCLIRQYAIPGTAEFLRRVLLFLLNSKDIPDLRTSDEPEELENIYFDDNETYTNNRLSRKDFVRSIYQ